MPESPPTSAGAVPAGAPSAGVLSAEALSAGAASAGPANPLVPLFAAYCGGLARERDLAEALQRLASGRLQGVRRLRNGREHGFELRWSGEPAPLETLQCSLSFPALPAVHYAFSVSCQQLVRWLMDCRGDELPERFWPWLLQGRSLD